jgi:hypothetical protein
LGDPSDRSERRSRKRPSKRPELILLVDENLGFQLIADALADVDGVTLKSAKLEFGEGVEDQALISLIGAKGWALR